MNTEYLLMNVEGLAPERSRRVCSSLHHSKFGVLYSIFFWPLSEMSLNVYNKNMFTYNETICIFVLKIN